MHCPLDATPLWKAAMTGGLPDGQRHAGSGPFGRTGLKTMELPSPDTHVIDRKQRIVQLLRMVVPHEAIVDNERQTLAYECDALTARRCPPLAVALPSTTEEVSKLLEICHRERVPVVPRGAGTSLSGGALPTSDSVVICTARLNEILEIDCDSRFVRVQSGITNVSVTQAVENDGFFYAPDPSSQLACTIAGNVAMNSGGAHCLKYGVTTNNLLGVRMVLMDGEIVDIGGESFDAPGLDLLGLVCGSEGQLGIVTEAVLRILPKPEGARPTLIGFDSAEVAGKCVADIIGAGVLPVAIEFMDKTCNRVSEEFSGAGYPDVEALLIVEVEGSPEEIEYQQGLITQVAWRHNPVEVRESASEEESLKIWAGRKAAFGAMGSVGDYICLDGTIPVSKLSVALRGIEELSKTYKLKVANVFHAGDGNLHPMIIFDTNNAAEMKRSEELGAEILKLCVRNGGCLSGEHGVGIEKRELMTTQFTEDDLEMQMRIKDVFDERWLLNSAKVFPLELSQARRMQ